MIANSETSRIQKKSKQDDAAFEQMLPEIERQAQHALRGVRRELREELVAEVVANAFCMFRRLVQRNKADLAFATPLASYAIKQVRQSRRVTTAMNIRDVSSYRCRKKNHIKRHPLGKDHEHDRENIRSWQDEVLVEDKTATPAATAAIRIDFADWLKSLDRKRRRVDKMLAKNETTRRTARKFKLSEGRISQIRRELEHSWLQFQNELPAPAASQTPPITDTDRSLTAVSNAV